MRPAHRVFVVLDLSSCVVVDPHGFQRCIETAMKAADVMPGAAGSPVLQEVYDALDRVFVAHLTADPFVEELPGTSELLSSLARANTPVFGVGTFAPTLITAIARRFGWWFSLGTAQAETPLWSAASLAAGLAGYEPHEVALVSDDRWELTIAAREGCGMPIHVDRSRRGLQPDDAGVLHASSMRDVGRFLERRPSTADRSAAPASI